MDDYKVKLQVQLFLHMITFTLSKVKPVLNAFTI